MFSTRRSREHAAFLQGVREWVEQQQKVAELMRSKRYAEVQQQLQQRRSGSDRI